MLMPSPCFAYLTAALIAVAQLIESSPVWSADSQRGGRAPWIVSGVRGEVLVLPAGAPSAGPLRFRATVTHGDQLTIGSGSIVEVLVGKYAVVTAYEESTVRFLDEQLGHTMVELLKGELQVSVARGDQIVEVRTTAATATTHGGLLLVRVIPGAQHATAAPVHAAWSTQKQTVAPMAGGPAPEEFFEAHEGTIRLKLSAPGNAPITMETGRSLYIVAGQIREFLATLSKPALTEPLPATGSHALTAPRGIQHLALQERSHAEALQRMLLGDPGIPEQQIIRQIEFTDVILPTSYGIPNPALGQNNPAGSSAGTPAASSPVASPPIAPPVLAAPPTPPSTPSMPRPL
jgi:hypothetical protein